MNTIDFQIQTTSSDGKHSPRECVLMAKENGLSAIAITDHDTVDGVEEALRAAGETGVRVIPGVELSAEEHDIHILGYGIDYRSPQFLAILDKSKQSRLEGAKQILANLQKNEGFIVDWEDVIREAGGASVVTSPHIVYAVMNRQENKERLERDNVHTKADFYDKYLSRNGPNYVKRYHFSAKDTITFIHEAGGVAVWSHPMLNFRNDYEGAEEFLKKLLEWDLDGVEVFSPSHTEDAVEFLQGLSVKYNVLRTAGSDFHEMADHPHDPASGLHSARTVGDYETYGFSTEDIVEKLDRAIQNRRQATAASSQ